MPGLTVYTCEVGGYDLLAEPYGQETDVEFICFTDRPNRRVRGWQLRPLHKTPVDEPGLVNRWHKCFPHRLGLPTEWSIYVDSNIRIAGPLHGHIERTQAKGARFSCPLHTRRQSLEEEVEACEKLGKLDSNQAVDAKQRLTNYHSAGLPLDTRLLENNIVVRHHVDPEVSELSERWWDQLLEVHGRDQLVLPYVLWESRVPFVPLQENAFDEGGCFHHYAHRQKGFKHLAQIISLRRHRFPYKLMYRMFHSIVRD